MIGEAAAALHASELAQFARGSAWFYPAMASIHVLGAALLIGTIALLDLRLLGFAKGVAVAALQPLAVRVALIAAVFCVASGAPLFAAGAISLIANPIFLVKLAALVLAAANAALHHRGAGASALHGAVSLGCWATVAVAGKLAVFV
ncbi:MAG: hypothetical protein J0H39_12610 [Alphaproteobacteria bacterium]|nr:hypothetical protein [Alphaproteobacteria bacterium]